MSAFKIEDHSSDFVCATYESALIYRFIGVLTSEVLLRVDAVHDRLASRYPVTVAIGMNAANQKLPDAAVRALSSKLIAKRPPEAVISAIILEGSGMWAAAARAAIATMFLLASSNRKNKVFATANEACAWVAPLVTPALPLNELITHSLTVQSYISGKS